MLPCTIYNYYYSSGETHAVIHLPLVAFGSTTAVFFSTHRKKRKEKKKKKKKKKRKEKEKKEPARQQPFLAGSFPQPLFITEILTPTVPRSLYIHTKPHHLSDQCFHAKIRPDPECHRFSLLLLVAIASPPLPPPAARLSTASLARAAVSGTITVPWVGKGEAISRRWTPCRRTATATGRVSTYVDVRAAPRSTFKIIQLARRDAVQTAVPMKSQTHNIQIARFLSACRERMGDFAHYFF
jgi:hypothetical protein